MADQSKWGSEAHHPVSRTDKIKNILQKLTWLENILQELTNMDKYNRVNTHANMQYYLCLIDVFKEQLQRGRLITKSDMGQCNGILKNMKRKYKFNIGWRGNIESNQYSEYILNKKNNKINIIYSWDK